MGDDDQCIYGWRGSDVEYMVHFNERYENVVDYSLSRNFRSTPEIVAAANSLIEKNQNRLEKQMYTKIHMAQSRCITACRMKKTKRYGLQNR